MEKIKCITFDKKAQDNLPEHIKAKMKADREKATKPKIPCGICESKHNVSISETERNIDDIAERIVKSVCEECGKGEQTAVTPLCLECLSKLYDEQNVL